jgi:hypothetical protein
MVVIVLLVCDGSICVYPLYLLSICKFVGRNREACNKVQEVGRHEIVRSFTVLGVLKIWRCSRYAAVPFLMIWPLLLAEVLSAQRKRF